ncbi:hypothetical protein B0H34DRAFT_273504 [Crassisporium funariophilum]|nr:hypothetical protein B0H34DRAFT_273504 [Crassisporium funariophilum]
MTSPQSLPADIGKMPSCSGISDSLGFVRCSFNASLLVLPGVSGRFSQSQGPGVYGVYLLEIIQTVIMTRSAFHAFGEGFGNYKALDDIGLQWLGVPLISAVVGFLAEGVYAYRLKVLSKSNIVTGLIIGLAIIQLGGGIATAITIKHTAYFSRLPNMCSFIVGGIWGGGTFLCDAAIAIFMTYYLVRGRSRSGFRQTRVLVTKIIRLTIETGTITAAIALINFTLALLPGHPPYWEAVAAILGKVYSNSMMVVFNSRMKVSRDVPAQEVDMVSSLRFDEAAANGSLVYPIAFNGEILVTREAHMSPLTRIESTMKDTPIDWVETRV